MSTQIDDPIEQELREAFHAAAVTVTPTVRPLPSRSARGPHPESHARVRRWLVPAVAAAVVLAIGLPLLAFTLLRGATGPDIEAASAVTLSGGRATVAGVSFPVPDGWKAKTVAHTGTSVTVCIAAQPAERCGGVALRIAVPDGDGDITPVEDPITTAEAECPDTQVKGHGLYPEVVDQDDLGGRPAVHYAIGCGPTGPRSAGWFVTDGSLALSTPRGVAGARATRIASGIDFSGYHHIYGPQVMFISGPGVASWSDANSERAPFDGRTFDLAGIRIPLPQDWSADTIGKNDTTATVCVAAVPAADCDGVTVRFATGAASIPVQEQFAHACDRHDSRWTDQGATVIGGRAAHHYTGTCTPGAAESDLWLLSDGSLAIWTPSGKYADLAATIARGLDLRTWTHPQGPPVLPGTTVAAHSATADGTGTTATSSAPVAVTSTDSAATTNGAVPTG